MTNRHKTLLVVDDEIGIRQGYIDFFEDRLWTVLEAESGEKAIEILSIYNPVIAIVDIRMSNMDGFQFIRKAREINPDLYYIISTGSTVDDIPDDIMGFNEVSKNIIKKPIIDMKIMESEITNILRKRV